MNKTAGATQHKIPAIAALIEYFKLHLIRFGFFSVAIFFTFYNSKLTNMLLESVKTTTKVFKQALKFNF
jgi:hypothetical protein